MDLNDTLKDRLRTLRLSGVLQTLDARHRQAIDAQWSYLDFLTRLLEDEVERRAGYPPGDATTLACAPGHDQQHQDP